MKSDLSELWISEREIEHLSGFDVSDLFVGGVLGVYRPSKLRDRKQRLYFWLTEAIVLLLLFMLSFPIGLFAIRETASRGPDGPTALKFLLITFGSTVAVAIAWNVYRRRAIQRLKPFLRLLDDLDRFHDVLRSIELFDNLEAAGADRWPNRPEVMQILCTTRAAFISGFMTEKLLRAGRDRSIQRYDLLAQIEENLAILSTLGTQNSE